MQLYILFQTQFEQATAGRNIKFKLEKKQVYHNIFFFFKFEINSKIKYRDILGSILPNVF